MPAGDPFERLGWLSAYAIRMLAGVLGSPGVRLAFNPGEVAQRSVNRMSVSTKLRASVDGSGRCLAPPNLVSLEGND
jgi:hypothetical protein